MVVAFAACADGPVNVTAFCAEQGISRQTFYVYRRRFQAEGIQGLLPRSRRPTRSPSMTSEAVVAAVLEVHDQLHDQGWDAGARSVRDRIARQGLAAPSDRTIHRILAGHERVKTSPKKRRRDSYRRFEATAPNGMWQLFGIEHIIPRRHVAFAVGHGIDETRVSIARKSTQVDCPLRITHARAMARRTIAREQIGTLLDLLRREFRRALLSCGGQAEERQAEAGGHKSVHAPEFIRASARTSSPNRPPG